MRTVTRVDAELLAHSAVEFVGSATIGTDHLDTDFLRRNGIAFSNAAGCNAEAAAEYVVSGLYALSARHGFDPARLTAGIVGYGNVGRRLHAKLTALGIDCRLCDPPLAARGGGGQPLVALDEIIDECDFISLHVPLTRDGEHPTFHLLDGDRLARLRRHCLLVNAARGEVVDNRALRDLLRDRADLRVFLDTWEKRTAARPRVAARGRPRHAAHRRLQCRGPPARHANGARRGLQALRPRRRLAHAIAVTRRG